MAEEVVKPVVDWDHPEGKEPDWPGDKKPKTHVCDGCGEPRPVDVFEAVDAFIAGRDVLLVRCDVCRERKPSTIPYDDREAKA